MTEKSICFESVVQWPWIDMGAIGPTKRLLGIDLVATGNPRIAIGFDQVNQNVFTPDYTLPPDTLTGGMIPYSLAGPTFSLRVRFAAGAPWSLKSALLYVDDSRAQP